MEKTIELVIPILLPGIESEQDECLARLETALRNHKGILRAHLEKDKTPVDLCLHYDPNLLSLSEVKNIAEKADAQITNRFHHESIAIEGMDCSDWIVVLEHGIGRIEGVLSVNVNCAAEKMWVEFDKQLVNRDVIEKRVRSLGYFIPLSEAQTRFQDNREIIFSLLSGFFLLAGWIVGTFLRLPEGVSLSLYIAA